MHLLLLYLLGINIVTFMLRGRDKQKATKGGRRVSEKQLLRCVSLGGGGGALAGQQLFRHKTIKGSFVQKMYLLCGVWIILILLSICLNNEHVYGTP